VRAGIIPDLNQECRTQEVFYVPGEHDIYDNGAQYRERSSGSVPKPVPVVAETAQLKKMLGLNQRTGLCLGEGRPAHGGQSGDLGI
jgi:hypothetical protein